MLQNHFFDNLFIFCVFYIFCICCAYSKDYGIHGNVFEIQEENLLEYIYSYLSKIDINKFQNDFKRNVKNSINRPKSVLLKYAIEERTYYFNPSIILNRDYMDNKGYIFARKGTKINPLKQMNLSNKLIFIDGDNKKQLQYAINFYKENNGMVKIILVNGAVIDLMETLKIRLYFDQNGVLINKFNIKYLLAIVFQENEFLKITEIVLNYE